MMATLPRAEFVLVTGATDGIGAIMALLYARSGAKVIATGRKVQPRGVKFFDHPNVTYLHADQSDPLRTGRLVGDAIGSIGWPGLDRAILNAGTGWTGNPEDEPLAQVVSQVDINLAAPIHIAQAVSSALFARHGQLTLIGSVTHKGASGFATYAATKAGLDGFARSLREEWRGRANVQIIHPGAMRTDMHQKAGLTLGGVRKLFAPPNRAANKLLAVIEKGLPNKTVSGRSMMMGGWRIPSALRV